MMKSNRRSRHKPAIGYLRVSTKEQGRSGIGFEGQRAAIEKFCELEGWQITDWFQDVASGMGEESAAKREGLKKAVDRAREQGMPLIVSELDRLSRHTKTLEAIIIEGDVAVISTDGATTSPHSVRSGAAKAEAQGKRISETTRLALKKKKEAGILLGNRTNLDVARAAGAAANKDRALEKANEIADHLERIGGAASLSAQEVVDRLNAAGILSGLGRPWTVPGIRRPLANAKEILRDRAISKKEISKLPNYGRFG